jgi:hypothetical protein
MEDDRRRTAALEEIRQNIAVKGHHIYVVSGAPEPRFVYTIGLSEKLGAELILAGAIFYVLEEVVRIVNEIAAKLEPKVAWETLSCTVDSCGSFFLRKTDASWANALMLGALDFYQATEVPAFQIVPDKDHWTIDVPDMSNPWTTNTAGAWRCLHEPWTHPVPVKSTAVTNLAALQGERITEATRWEEDGWEIFAGAGPDVSSNEMRVVPLGTLLESDESLEAVVHLPIGKGLWRDSTSDWHSWG